VSQPKYFSLKNTIFTSAFNRNQKNKPVLSPLKLTNLTKLVESKTLNHKLYQSARK